MSVYVRSTPEKGLEARVSKTPEFYCLSCEDVQIENYNMRVWHYLCCPQNDNPSVIWIFNRMTMTVLCRNNFLEGPSIVFNGRTTDAVSTRVFHDSPHLLVVPDIGRGDAYHTNMKGECFAGSNTHGRDNTDARLCLGEHFGPYDFSAVHLLCNFDANADLGWRGSPLTIETPIQNNQRTVTSWPTIPYSVQVPQQISAFFDH